MALIAKEDLLVNGRVAARKGVAVNPEHVELFGWHDKVRDDGDAPAKPAARKTAAKKTAAKKPAARRKR